MNEVVTTSYKPIYLVLSYVISVLGCYAGLMASRHILDTTGRVNWLNAIAAGIGIGGIGVWSMHFIGMLALQFGLASGYALTETVVSLVAAVAATTMALVYVAKGPNQFSRILVAGFALGMGVVVMHYLGMYGMRFGGVFRWDMGLVALSVAIAVVAATAALWLSFRSVSVLVRFAAALVMGVAVCAMHYTGVAAADIICTTTDRAAYPKGFDVIRSFLMPSLVIFFSLSMAAVVIIDQFMIAGSQKK